MGLRAERLQEMLAKRHLPDSDSDSAFDVREVLKTVRSQEKNVVRG